MYPSAILVHPIPWLQDLAIHLCTQIASTDYFMRQGSNHHPSTKIGECSSAKRQSRLNSPSRRGDSSTHTTPRPPRQKSHLGSEHTKFYTLGNMAVDVEMYVHVGDGYTSRYSGTCRDSSQVLHEFQGTCLRGAQYHTY